MAIQKAAGAGVGLLEGWPAGTRGRGRREDGPATAILDQLSVAVLVTDREGRCSFLNACAIELLAAADGVRMVGGEILGAEYPGDAHTLRSALQKTCDEGGGGAIMINRSAHPQPLLGVVAPFEDRSGGGPRAMLMLRRGGIRADVVAQHLRSLFRLSPAEAEIGVALATGAELSDIAAGRNVTVNTLRSQIASIMGKTGTRRQAELVALVCRLDTPLR
jgi:DNA-binding CsgD family transcriptional regulator